MRDAAKNPKSPSLTSLLALGGTDSGADVKRLRPRLLALGSRSQDETPLLSLAHLTSAGAQFISIGCHVVSNSRIRRAAASPPLSPRVLERVRG